MYFKLAFKNVRKSFKDYSIYFLTLTFAVCIFYSFNSIGSQKAFLEMESMELEIINSLVSVMAYISIFVSFIVASLMIYGNRFLIKRRKKEFGTYMVLGMGKSKISKILFFETFIVGLISLIFGLLIGILVSQGVSFMTISLFEVSMKDYAFVISLEAIKKSIIYFILMFGFTIIFNVAVVSKYKIINLLNAGRSNEDIKVKNSYIYTLFFIISIIFLYFAYSFILDIGFNPTDIKFSISILLGILGTIFFFFGISGIIIFIISKVKSVYFSGINIFTTKQLSSKINTNFLAMAMISLMLFMTISVLSTGIGLKDAIESNTDKATPFDASATSYMGENGIVDMKNSLEIAGMEFNNGEEYAIIDIYGLEKNIMDIFLLEDKSNELSKFNLELSAVKLSEYNDLMDLKGENRVELSENEVLVLGNYQYVRDSVNEYMKANDVITFNDKDFIMKNDLLKEDNLYNTMFTNLFPTLVFNDEVIKDFDIRERHININYSEDNRDISEKNLLNAFDSYKSEGWSISENGFLTGETKNTIIIANKGITTITLFIGMYLGIVFLVTSMAILGLQQLSEASDSINRYTSLRKIGVSDKMVNKSIFNQIFIQFSFPLFLAIIHSIVAIIVMGRLIAMFNEFNITKSALSTVILLMVVYIGYFIATYFGYKNIINKNKI